MKKYINNISSLLAALLVLTSCDPERLDLVPESAIGDNGFYQNAEQVGGAVIAIYDGLQNIPLREFALTEMRSDNARTKTSEGEWAQFQDLAVQPTNGVVGQYWADNYNVIFRANRVLESLDAVGDAALKGQFEGEAKFARAFAHFNLVRAYGDVPLITQTIGPNDADFFDRDAASTVYGAIESDLSAAASLLPANTTFGRATSGAANAMLAKVKLTTGDYSGAASLLNAIINGGTYSLAASYSSVFYDEENSEIIFAIPYINDDANESQDFSYEMTDRGRASGLNFWTDDFANSLDPADTRAATLFNPLKPGETGKFLTSSSDVRLCGNDWIVLRLADVLLMHAEAVMAGAASTTDAGAIASVNQVRTRVGLDPITGTLTKEMLAQERRVELAFENQRLYDLVRMGMSDVLAAFASANGHSFSTTDLLLPIPQAEINISEGALTQNPGY